MVFSFIGKTKNKHEKCASTSISFVTVTGSYLPLVVEKGVKTSIVVTVDKLIEQSYKVVFILAFFLIL